MSLICGLKLTHDGAVAVLDESDDGRVRLVGAIEVEKLGNRLRHAPLADSGVLRDSLALMGVKPGDVDRWVVDGWFPDEVKTIGAGAVAPPYRISNDPDGDGLVVAPYCQGEGDFPVLHPHGSGRLDFDGLDVEYESYRHAEGHLASAYLTGPAGKDAVVVVWDGRMAAQAYVVRRTGVEFVGCPIGMPGHFFEEFACNIEPFTADPNDSWVRQFHKRVSVPGKAMAFAGLGRPDGEVVGRIKRAFGGLPAELYGAVAGMADGPTLMASLQQAVGELLVEAVAPLAGEAEALCFAGGSALNIKWNSALRASGLFDDVWVPPFPNDSGSAIGAACASVMARGGYAGLDWSVYSGPELADSAVPAGWSVQRCGVDDLVGLLVRGEPVVVLHGKAELGPRALGHRSILADPRNPRMKTRLNEIKGREDFRPVAPMCLEDMAPVIFEPGTADPYMLFDHKVRTGWLNRIPAVVHVDGTARLQTVQEGFAAEVVRKFYARTGVPVLCNTSANLNGSGFFPDAASAMAWGRVAHVWADGVLYIKTGGYE